MKKILKYMAVVGFSLFPVLGAAQLSIAINENNPRGTISANFSDNPIAGKLYIAVQLPNGDYSFLTGNKLFTEGVAIDSISSLYNNQGETLVFKELIGDSSNIELFTFPIESSFTLYQLILGKEATVVDFNKLSFSKKNHTF